MTLFYIYLFCILSFVGFLAYHIHKAPLLPGCDPDDPETVWDNK